MELILVRHALPERQHVTTGAADPPLSKTGVEQAAKVAAWLSSETIDVVYSSPMRRAKETALAYTQHSGHTVQFDEGVVEFDRHTSSYIPMEELKRTDYAAWKAFADGRYNEEIDILAFQDTVVRALESIIARHQGSRVAVFCHGGVINVWAAYVFSLGPRLFFEPFYTSINRFVCARTGERNVVSLNETGHLRN
ncbi:MAG TPA: histidine phosphatase family protein [Pseudomonadales bacterium]